MINYKKEIGIEGIVDSITKIQNGVSVMSIPMNEANTDYQEYLEWLAEGNTPEEAE